MRAVECSDGTCMGENPAMLLVDSLTSLEPSLLLQLDNEYFNTQSACKLSTWERSLRHNQAKRLASFTRTAYDRMMNIVNASDPIMNAIVQNLLLTGEPCKLMPHLPIG